MVFIEDPLKIPDQTQPYYPLFTAKQSVQLLKHYRVTHKELILQLRSYNRNYEFLFPVLIEAMVYQKIIRICLDQLYNKFNLTNLQTYIKLSSEEDYFKINSDCTELELFHLVNIVKLCTELYGLQFFWFNSLKRSTSTYLINKWSSNLLDKKEVILNLKNFVSQLSIKALELKSKFNTGFMYIVVNSQDLLPSIAFCKIPPYMKHVILGGSSLYNLKFSSIELDCFYLPWIKILNLDLYSVDYIIRTYIKAI